MSRTIYRYLLITTLALCPAFAWAQDPPVEPPPAVERDAPPPPEPEIKTPDPHAVMAGTESAPKPEQAILINPLLTLISIPIGFAVALEYQYQLTDGFALTIEPWIFYIDFKYLTRITGLIVAPKLGARWSFGEGLEGWFVRPGFWPILTNLDGDDKPDEPDFSVGLSFDAGYQWIWDSGFTLNLTGLIGSIITVDDVNDSLPMYGIDIKTGYAF